MMRTKHIKISSTVMGDMRHPRTNYGLRPRRGPD